MLRARSLEFKSHSAIHKFFHWDSVPIIYKMGQSCCFEELLVLGSPFRTDAGSPECGPKKWQGLGLWGPP